MPNTGAACSVVAVISRVYRRGEGGASSYPVASYKPAYLSLSSGLLDAVQIRNDKEQSSAPGFEGFPFFIVIAVPVINGSDVLLDVIKDLSNR